jgi:hypothetical protein
MIYTRRDSHTKTEGKNEMTKKFLISSAITAAFIATASLSSANAAGWGADKNGNSYGGTPTQESTPSNNTRPRPRPSTQTGGYGGDSENNTRPQRRPSGTYGGNTYPSRDTDTYQPRRYPGPYFPKRDYGDRPYNDGPGPVIYRPSRDTGTYGGTYNGDQSMPSRPTRPSRPTTDTTGDWNKSGGYGGKQ